MANSLYIHIPFCRRKCLYCDFYSAVYDPAMAKAYPGPEARDGRAFQRKDQAYVDALLAEIERLDGRFETVYIGGGTPTVLDNKLLDRLLQGLGKNLSDSTEFTIEANPESLDLNKLDILLGCGVNRLSIGLQSLDDRILKKLGRIHDARRGADAVRLAAKKGFSNISADLIFGVWGEEPKHWESQLEEATKLPLKHISAYALTYEKKTPLFDALKNKSVTPLEDETVAAMYEAAIDRLALRGFKQYEVSSFAKEPFQCRHNLSYWENNPYIGLGASAVSYSGGVRTKNVASVSEYIARAQDGRPLAESSEKLSPLRRAKETAAIKIRTKDGIGFAWFKEKTGFDFMELEGKAVAELIDKDLIKYRKEGSAPTGIALKRKGFLFCDTVSSTLL